MTEPQQHSQDARDEQNTTKKMGRKPRSIERANRTADMDRLLVEGELVTSDDGEQTRVYPLGREVAERLGMSPAWVSKYAHQHRCFQRRAEYRAKVLASVQERLIERESKRLVFDTERTLCMCDKVLARLDEAVDERGVGNFSVADMNTVVRLRRYLQGDADSRQEVTSAITLDTLQVAHRDMLRRVHDATPEECGLESDEEHQLPVNPPTPPFVDAVSKSQIHQEIHPPEGVLNVREGTKSDIRPADCL